MAKRWSGKLTTHCESIEHMNALQLTVGMSQEICSKSLSWGIAKGSLLSSMGRLNPQLWGAGDSVVGICSSAEGKFPTHAPFWRRAGF